MGLRVRKTTVLWGVQVLLALLFLFAGGMKLFMPVEMMTQGTSLSGGFMRFIGVAEILGGLGLVMPGLFNIKTGLTPLAAIGLVVIMIGATTVTVATLGVAAAIIPFVTGLLAATVAYARWRLVPFGDRSNFFDRSRAAA